MLKHVLVLFWVPSWTSFGDYFWSPFWDPKLVQNLLIFGSILDPFFLGFRSSLGGLKSEKMQTVPRENHFFENVAFLVFEALVRKWAPKWSPKGVQKVTKKWSTKSSPMVQKIVKIITLFCWLVIPYLILEQHYHTFFKKCSFAWDIRQKSLWPLVPRPGGLKKKTFTSKMSPRWLQNCPR